MTGPWVGPIPARFRVWGPIERSDLPGLSDRICRLLRPHHGILLDCDVAGVEPDAVTVDALARLQLAARRRNCRIRLRNASDELLDLVALLGLGEVFAEAGSGVQSRGEPEQRKERLGAEEEGELADPPGPHLEHL